VSKMFAEAGDVREAETNFYADQQKAIADNVFSKAGLPQPTERYTMETVPRTSSQSAMLQSIMSEGDRLARERADISETASEAEKVARGRFDKAARENPSKSVILELGVPRDLREARNYANQLGIDEDWYVTKWQRAYNKSTDSEAGEGSTDWNALKSFLAEDIENEISGSAENFAEWANFSNLDKDRALKVRAAMESGKFELKPRQMKPSEEEAGEVQRFRNVAGVQAGRDATQKQRTETQRRQDAFDFKSGLASAMLAGSARGRNTVTSPLQDALLSRLRAGLGM